MADGLMKIQTLQDIVKNGTFKGDYEQRFWFMGKTVVCGDTGVGYSSGVKIIRFSRSQGKIFNKALFQPPGNYKGTVCGFTFTIKKQRFIIYFVFPQGGKIF